MKNKTCFGNEHFIFQNLNNDVVADHVENWIQAQSHAFL